MANLLRRLAGLALYRLIGPPQDQQPTQAAAIHYSQTVERLAVQAVFGDFDGKDGALR